MIKLISLDVWDTILVGNPENKIKRSKLLSELLSLDEKLIANAARDIGRELETITETTGQDLSGDVRIITLIERLTGKKANLEIINKVKSIFESVFLENLPLLIEKDLPETLKEIKAKKFKIALLSNTGFIIGKTMRNALSSLGLLDIIDYTVFSDEVGAGKPDPRMFESLAQIAGIKAGEILHVGNNFVTDYRGAIEAGCQAQLFDIDSANSGNDVKSISRISDLIKLI
jgi:putative hydrolase of the HAD superfamily